MTFAQLKAAFKKKEFAPIYLFHGDETYYIDQLEAALEATALQEHEKAFNHQIIYGKDADHLAVVDAARRFPMMAERQLIVLREAQDMRSINELANYAGRPAPTTILAICHKHKRVKLNTKLAKAIKQSGVIFEAKGLYDNQVPDWIVGYLKGKKHSVEPAASNLLAEYLGTKLSKIANELDKLLINLAPGTTITTKIVEEQVGISKDYNVFELQKALGFKDAVKVARIINYFTANPKAGPLPVVMASLYTYFSKLFLLGELRARQASEQEIVSTLKTKSFFLREYNTALRNYPGGQVARVIGLLREYDLKSKGVGSLTAARTDGELLKELAFRIMR
ncbi:DNA polymerase III subunit delta [Lewinellaceae bacterium SD302]|nr:DNA polymerase III subunit delta [Lewinellaceae bacterium SD302]